jgi:archaellin
VPATVPATVVRVHPRPTVTLVLSGPTIAAGRSGTVRAQAGVRVRLTASAPRVSTTRLSSSYGYGPQHGYYVTFTVAAVNTGTRPIDLRPTDFFVTVAGQRPVTSYDGNAPYSGAPQQLDSTQLDPGQSVTGWLTYDVRHPHGTLSYAPDGSAALSWRF